MHPCTQRDQRARIPIPLVWSVQTSTPGILSEHTFLVFSLKDRHKCGFANARNRRRSFHTESCASNEKTETYSQAQNVDLNRRGAFGLLTFDPPISRDARGGDWASISKQCWSQISLCGSRRFWLRAAPKRRERNEVEIMHIRNEWLIEDWNAIDHNDRRLIRWHGKQINEPTDCFCAYSISTCDARRVLI